MTLLSSVGCGDDLRPPATPLGQCDGAVVEVAGEPGLHIAPGQPIQWSSNPPATGAHYPAWAGWDRSYRALPRGYWLHNAEHGGVILLTNCPDGCADDEAALVALVQQQPADAQCAPPVRHRLVITSDPELPKGVRFAAVAWDAYYTATCLDVAALKTFIADHYARAPEDLCGDGLAMDGTRIP